MVCNKSLRLDSFLTNANKRDSSATETCDEDPCPLLSVLLLAWQGPMVEWVEPEVEGVLLVLLRLQLALSSCSFERFWHADILEILPHAFMSRNLFICAHWSIVNATPSWSITKKTMSTFHGSLGAQKRQKQTIPKIHSGTARGFGHSFHGILMAQFPVTPLSSSTHSDTDARRKGDVGGARPIPPWQMFTLRKPKFNIFS